MTAINSDFREYHTCPRHDRRERPECRWRPAVETGWPPSRIMVTSRRRNQALERTALGYLRVPPRSAASVRKRAATSKTRRRRSDTSGTRFVGINERRRVGECPKCRFTAPRRTLVAARSSLAVHPGAFGLSSCLSRCSHRGLRLRRGRTTRQPTAWPSARPTGAVAAHAFGDHK
jgi:hypothetical protein